jgi:hypothetical protein
LSTDIEIATHNTDRVAVLEDSVYRNRYLLGELGSRARFFLSGEKFMAHVKETEPAIVMLDHDLGGGITAMPVAEVLAAMPYRGRVVIHILNPVGAQRMTVVLTNGDVTVTAIPFGMFYFRTE